jgi:hypothetical protein
VRAGRFIVGAVVALAIGLVALLPANARDRSVHPPEQHVPRAVVGSLDAAVAQRFATELVDTAVEDLALLDDSVPALTTGVLGARADTTDRMHRYVAQRRAAAQAAFLAARARALAAARASSAGSGRSTGRCNGDFACFKPCTLEIESHGNYAAISPGGTYRGAWQFDQSTWNGAVARAGHPEWSNRDPAQAPPHVQDAAARQLYAERGNQPWGGRC